MMIMSMKDEKWRDNHKRKRYVVWVLMWVFLWVFIMKVTGFSVSRGVQYDLFLCNEVCNVVNKITRFWIMLLVIRIGKVKEKYVDNCKHSTLRLILLFARNVTLNNNVTH